MSGAIRIVTDSSAQFIDPQVVQRYNITVVPLEISLGTQVYREGIDISSEQFHRKLMENEELPTLLPPKVEQFSQIYNSLHRETDRIISLHISRAMHPTWQHARAASEDLLGRCEIAVVDSQTTSIGLAILVEAAAKFALEMDNVDDIVRAVRKLTPQIYSIFSTESLYYLRRSGLLSESQALLGGMLGIKPFLTIEDGELIAMEKSRTRVQVVDKLVEFVSEFGDVDQLVVLESGLPATDAVVHALKERINDEMATRPFSTLTYAPSLACFLGPEATGVVVFERDGQLNTNDKDEAISDPLSMDED